MGVFSPNVRPLPTTNNMALTASSPAALNLVPPEHLEPPRGDEQQYIVRDECALLLDGLPPPPRAPGGARPPRPRLPRPRLSRAPGSPRARLCAGWRLRQGASRPFCPRVPLARPRERAAGRAAR